MSSAERRDRLIRILKMNGTVTVEYLSNRLQVSERTILRDITELSIRYPITTQPGRHGGVSLLHTSEPPKTVLPPSEIALLTKIIRQAENNGQATLTSEEISFLKEIVATYSKS